MLCWNAFEFSGSNIFREVETRKVRRKCTGSVAGHNFKMEE